MSTRMATEFGCFQKPDVLRDPDGGRWFVTTYVAGPTGVWEAVETLQVPDESRAFAQAELVIRDHAAAVVYRESAEAKGERKIVAIRTFRQAP